MHINNQHYHTIWINDEHTKIKIIDQRHLPFHFIVEELCTVEDTFTAIRDMHVRGAPLIGVTGAFGMYLATLQHANRDNCLENITSSAAYLKSSRPTAVNLAYAIDLVLERIKKSPNSENYSDIALTAAKELKTKEIDNCRAIGAFGMQLIKEISERKNGEPVNILTHCNAGWLACIDYGTATAPVYLAHENGIKVHVWVDETRPRNQGARLTAYELSQEGVPNTVIADNTGGHLMQHGMVDMVITGSDRTTKTGDVANKIGTYLKALAAKDNNIPFYVALPSSTIDWQLSDGVKEIPIEQRETNEVKYIEGLADDEIKEVLLTTQNTTCINYAFDVTPRRLVTGLITERGICSANEKSLQGLFKT
jgi:methylthioribose-1-phosphate isomerase